MPAAGFEPAISMLRRSGCRALRPLGQAGVDVILAKWNSDSKPGWMKNVGGRGGNRTRGPASVLIPEVSLRPLGYAVPWPTIKQPSSYSAYDRDYSQAFSHERHTIDHPFQLVKQNKAMKGLLIAWEYITFCVLLDESITAMAFANDLTVDM